MNCNLLTLHMKYKKIAMGSYEACMDGHLESYQTLAYVPYMSKTYNNFQLLMVIATVCINNDMFANIH